MTQLCVCCATGGRLGGQPPPGHDPLTHRYELPVYYLSLDGGLLAVPPLFLHKRAVFEGHDILGIKYDLKNEGKNKSIYRVYSKNIYRVKMEKCGDADPPVFSCRPVWFHYMVR